MKVTFFLSALSATLAMAAPETQVVPNAIQPQACLPASCASFGVSIYLPTYLPILNKHTRSIAVVIVENDDG